MNMTPKTIKRLFCLMILSLSLLTGCNREEVIPAEIKVNVEKVTGSRASITVVPANLHAYYSYVLVCQDDESFHASASDICNREIQRMVENYSYFDSGSFTDVFCFRGSRRLTMRSLANDKDFKFILFQINPKTHQIIGEPIVREFHTQTVPERDLRFSIDFDGDVLRITPSDDNLTYVWQYEETGIIEDIYLNATSYLYMLVEMYMEYGFLDMAYEQGPLEWNLSTDDNLIDNTEHTLVVCGCEEAEFTTKTTIVKFRYHHGNIEVLEVIEDGGWQKQTGCGLCRIFAGMADSTNQQRLYPKNLAQYLQKRTP